MAGISPLPTRLPFRRIPRWIRFSTSLDRCSSPLDSSICWRSGTSCRPTSAPNWQSKSADWTYGRSTSWCAARQPPKTGPPWPGGPARRRHSDWQISTAPFWLKRRRARHAGAGGRPRGRCAGRRRAGDPAGIRPSQGHVLDRADLGKLAVPDPAGEDRGSLARGRHAHSAIPDDQPGDARRDRGLPGRQRKLRPAERRRARLLPGDDAGGRCRQRAACCWKRSIGWR